MPAKAKAIEAQRFSSDSVAESREERRGDSAAWPTVGSARHGAQGRQKESGDIGAERADILQPAPGLEAHDIEPHRQPECDSVAGRT